MSGGFKRSGVFGIVGVFVVAAGEEDEAEEGDDAEDQAQRRRQPRRRRRWRAGREPDDDRRARALGGPLIVIAALYGAFRAIGPGGEISQSYERTDRAMAPLGLAVSERPRGGFEMRMPTTPGFDYRLCDLWLAERLTATT